MLHLAGRRPPSAFLFMLVALGVAVLVPAGCSSGSTHAAKGSTTTAVSGPASTRSPTVTTSPRSSSSSGRTLVVRPAQWSLPAPLDREVAATLDGQIVVLGGNRDGGPTAIVDTIDPHTGAARRLALLASAEHDAAGGMLGGRPAMFGGGAGSATDAVQVVQADGTTTVVGHLPHARADVASASAHGVVYVVGGYDGAAVTPDVLATTDGVSFRVVGRLPIGVRYPAVAVAGDKLFVIGGATSGGENAGVDTDAVQVVDLRSGRVAVLAHMPATLSHATAVALHGTVYVLGGHVGGAWSDQVATFDPATGALDVVAHLPRAVSDTAATVVAGTAYLLGGETGPNAPIADVVEIRAPRQR